MNNKERKFNILNINDADVFKSFWHLTNEFELLTNLYGFGGLGVSALAFGTQVRGFKPGQICRIFQGKKILKRAFLQKGSKTVGLMSLIYGM